MYQHVVKKMGPIYTKKNKIYTKITMSLFMSCFFCIGFVTWTNIKNIILDVKNNNNNILNIFNNNKIITYTQIKNFYRFIQSKNYLLSLDHINEQKIANLNIIETSNELYRNGFYSESLLLLNEFDEDCSSIFNKIIETLLFGSDNDNINNDNIDIDNDYNDDNDNIINLNDLEMLLLDYDNIKNHYKYTF